MEVNIKFYCSGKCLKKKINSNILCVYAKDTIFAN